MELTGPSRKYVGKCVRDACVEYRRTFGQKDEFRFPGIAAENLPQFGVTVTEVEGTLVAALSTVVATYELERAEIDVEAHRRRRESIVKWMAKGAPAAVGRVSRSPSSNG